MVLLVYQYSNDIIFKNNIRNFISNIYYVKQKFKGRWNKWIF